MSTFSDDERRALGEAYLVANTPVSLCEWLERTAAVRRLSEFSDEDALLDGIHQSMRADVRSEETLGVAYALLVAIGLRRRARNSRVGTLPIESSLLTWGAVMWERLGRGTVSTTEKRIEVREPPKVLIQTEQGARAAGTLLVNQYGRPIARQD